MSEREIHIDDKSGNRVPRDRTEGGAIILRGEAADEWLEAHPDQSLPEDEAEEAPVEAEQPPLEEPAPEAEEKEAAPVEDKSAGKSRK
jgi:hypothetical protein